MGPGDDCDAVVNGMLVTGYNEEFCVALEWDPDFIARLMKAGFLVMSETIIEKGEEDVEKTVKRDIILPKLHLVRAVLFFKDLHIKRSIKKFLSRYELRFDSDFKTIIGKCLDTHGDGWLTPSLVETLFILREQSGPTAGSDPRPVSFGLYRDGELKAGEFGIICGRVYTSYSGYTEEDNAGTVQMILMVHWLLENGFAFLDFGMPLDYKTDLGARNINPEEFVTLWRNSRTL
ncbi:hypothetical protein AGMMS50230_12040 [Spirochaetia bacterium]|nr:hypothetical protein AGMMS50230_12040 [Spirochaetia bacterium]